MEKSFTVLTREEMARQKAGKHEALLAELAAFAFSSGEVSLGRGRVSLRLSGETEEVIRRMRSLLFRVYAHAPEVIASQKTQPKRHTVYAFSVAPEVKEGALLFDIGLLTGSPESYSFGTMKREVMACAPEAALRGAFLGCGVLCDPKKGYRLEFVLQNEDMAAFLTETLSSLGFNAGQANRQDRYVIYIKKSEQISDFLILTGAHSAMMELENVRVFKDVKNNLNRADNCLFGNMSKTVTAAQKQLDDIRALREAGVRLSEPLEEACLLRLQNPEASLQELAEASGRASKSALNKRFIKIHAMREGLQ